MRSIDPVLLRKIKEQNQTIWNNANPKMSISVARAKSTVMDSSYWTVETIRQKEGLGDLSITARRFKPYGPPNRLYNIYVDNSVVKTAIREYPDYKKLKWQNQFDVGVGSAVAIAFDGHWERYRKKWQLVTEENPYLFWVDGSKKLWVQLWDNVGTKYELASNVTKVKALRCWKNINIPDVDQGIVVGYIKSDGKVYYKNYAYQSSGQFAWEAERRITEFPGTSVNLNLFITNDYRMGFIVEDSSGNIRWAITSRAWAGMAIAPEHFFINPSVKIDLHKVKYYSRYHAEYFKITPSVSLSYLYGSDFNEFTSIENVDDGNGNYGIKVMFSVRHRIIAFAAADFELYDENNVRFRGLSGTKIDDYNFVVNFEDFNNAVGKVELRSLGTVATNEAGYLFAEFSGMFTPENLEPTAKEPPEVEVIWNE